MQPVWRIDDRLKTLAFGLCGCGCWMCYKAAGITSIYGHLGVLLAGFVFALSGVILALEIGNRKRSKVRPTEPLRVN